MNNLVSYEAILLLPINPIIGRGWKYYNSSLCRKFKQDHFIECIEKGAYTTKDIILNSNGANATPLYMSDYPGLFSHSLHIYPGHITYEIFTTFKIQLNVNISYIILIMDPKIQFLTPSHMTIPRTIVSIPQDAGMVQISLEVCENIEHIFLQTKKIAFK